ncbi:MAG: acetylglutamate kinase [Desulfobacteraceae bacterium]|jgi:acetylglutamate kinase|nr:acetylglutamate kinase [Desulfobacteraceae bacterium]
MNHRILIKIGGRAFEDESGFRELAEAILSAKKVEVIIVHGGGAEISQALKDAGRQTEFIDGIRVTRAEDIQIVEAVLSGTVNQRISSWLENNGVASMRLSGKSRRLFVVEPLTRNGQNLGFVGKIKQVNPAVAIDAIRSGKVPVISPISANEQGESYNVNADSAAAALAAAAHCTDLVFITDVPGVLIEKQTRSSLSIKEAQTLIAENVIAGGMVAKMESAFEALDQNVPRVHIIQWQGAHTLQEVVQQLSKAGTTVRR